MVDGKVGNGVRGGGGPMLVLVWCCAKEKEVGITRILGLELSSESDRKAQESGVLGPLKCQR